MKGIARLAFVLIGLLVTATAEAVPIDGEDLADLEGVVMLR